MELFETPALPQELSEIWDLIQPHRGRANAVPVRTVASAVCLHERAVRDRVKSLVEDHHYPICSGVEGFFIPVTSAEVREAERTLLSHAFSVMKRVRALSKSPHYDGLIGQLQLHLDSPLMR